MANSLYFIKTGMVSILRRVKTQFEGENEVSICVAEVGSGDVVGLESILGINESLVYPYTALCETYTICYKLDKTLIQGEEWSGTGLEKIHSHAISHPGDSVLLQSHFEDMKYKESSTAYLKTLCTHRR